MVRISVGVQALVLGAGTVWLFASAASSAATPPCPAQAIDCHTGLGVAVGGALITGLVGLVLALGLGCSAVLLGRAPAAWTVAVTAELLLGSVLVACLLYATQAGEPLLIPAGFALLACAAVLVGLCRRDMRLRCTPAARGRSGPPRPR